MEGSKLRDTLRDLSSRHKAISPMPRLHQNRKQVSIQDSKTPSTELSNGEPLEVLFTPLSWEKRQSLTEHTLQSWIQAVTSSSAMSLLVAVFRSSLVCSSLWRTVEEHCWWQSLYLCHSCSRALLARSRSAISCRRLFHLANNQRLHEACKPGSPQ